MFIYWWGTILLLFSFYVSGHIILLCNFLPHWSQLNLMFSLYVPGHINLECKFSIILVSINFCYTYYISASAEPESELSNRKIISWRNDDMVIFYKVKVQMRIKMMIIIINLFEGNVESNNMFLFIGEV